MKQNVLFLVGQLGTGGLEKQLFLLTKELVRREHNVKIFVWSNLEKNTYYSPIKRILGPNLIIPHTKSRIKKFISFTLLSLKWNSTVIVSFSNFTNLIALFAGFLSNTKSIGAHRRSTEYAIRKQGVIEKLSLLLPNRIFVNSQTAIKELIKYRKKKGLFYLPNIIDKPKSIDNNEEILYQSISIGTLKEEKRIDRLIEYCQLMTKYDSNFKHIHLGSGKNYNIIKNEIIQRGLSDNFLIPGNVAKINYYIQSSFVFVHFADYEGMPNVIMEAMIYGLPVVTTKCGDSVVLVKNNMNGYVIDPFEVESFARQVTKILRSNTLRTQMGKNSQKIIYKFFPKKISDMFVRYLH